MADWVDAYQESVPVIGPFNFRPAVPTCAHLPYYGQPGDVVCVEDESCAYAWVSGEWVTMTWPEEDDG